MTTQSQLDPKTISKLAEILDKNNLTELEYEDEGCRICLTRDFSSHAAPIAYAPAPIAQMQMPMPAAITATSPIQTVVENKSTDYSNHEGAIKSPMVGVAYLSPEPGAPTYVKVGDTVKAGDTICLIEAMKTFNPVKATKAGKISKILVEAGAPVEYGETLIIIE